MRFTSNAGLQHADLTSLFGPNEGEMELYRKLYTPFYRYFIFKETP